MVLLSKLHACSLDTSRSACFFYHLILQPDHLAIKQGSFDEDGGWTLQAGRAPALERHVTLLYKRARFT
jgi:hypothetical protein